MTNLLPFLAALIPILTLPLWFFYFDITPKIMVLLCGSCAVCVAAPWRMRGLSAMWRDSRGRVAVMLLALQAMVVLGSTALSTQRALSFAGSTWRYYGMVTQLALLAFTLYVVSEVASGAIRLQTTLRVIALSGSAIALYAIAQYFGWDPLLSSATYHIGEGEWMIVRPPGTIGHADYLGTYLLFVVFLGGSLFLKEDEFRWRMLGAACVLLGCFAVMLSGTRSAMLGLAVGACLAIFSYRPSGRKVALGLVLGLVAFASFYYSPYGLKMRGRARWFREDPAGGARLLLWRDSMSMASDRWWKGWGPETFSNEFPRYQSLELARAYPDFYHESPHNIVVDELVSKGFPGALPFLCWLAYAGYVSVQTLRRPKEAFLGIAFLAALVSLQFNAFVLTTAFFLYLTSALLMAQGLPEAAGVGRPRWSFAAVSLPLALLLAVYMVRLCVSDTMMATVRSAVEAGDVVGAARRYETVRKWEPREGAFDLYYSRNMAPLVRHQNQMLVAVKGWQEAMQAGIRATQFAEDRQNAFYHLASLYAQMDNRKDAERALRSAIDCAPNWFKPHWMLARVLMAQGRKEEAVKEATAAVERDGGKHTEVTETLNQITGPR